MDSANEFFQWIGNQLGRVLAAVVGVLKWVFANLYGWIDSFFNGLTRALGISPSIFSVLVTILGLMLLYAGLRALLRAHIFSALIWAFLGVLVLSWLMR